MSALSSFRRPAIRLGAIALSVAVPVTAWAHPGHAADGLLAGMLHPLTGADHLLATLGVGLLAGWAGLRRANGSNGSNDASGRPRSSGSTPSRSGGAESAGWRLGAGVALGVAAGMAMSAGHSGVIGGAGAIELAAGLSLVLVALLLLAVERLPVGLLALALALVALPHGYLHGLESSEASFAAGLAAASAALLTLGFVAGGRMTRLGDRVRRIAQGAMATGLALFSAVLMLA